MDGLRRALGGGPRLLVKRDDALPFAFGGNKVRKMQLVAADALRAGADTLITSGGIQSNHARVTAAAAQLGLHCILVVNGSQPDHPTANALLDGLLGAEIRYVDDRERARPGMEARRRDCARRAGSRHHSDRRLDAARCVRLRRRGRRAARAGGTPPDVIVHATSSGGTQAGLLAGCASAMPGTQSSA